MYQFVEYEEGRVGVPLMFIDIPRTDRSTAGHSTNISEQLAFILKSDEQILHGICFVVQANNFNIPNEQIERIQSVGRLFESTSIRDMICFLTFADAGPAHVEKYLKSCKMKFGISYSENCSAFHEKSKICSLFWESTTSCFADFCKHLETDQTTMKLRYLTPSRREELKSDIAKLQPKINEELAKLGEIKFQVKTYEENIHHILRYGNLSFTVDVITQRQIDLKPGNHITNCMQCFYICHDECRIEDDDKKIECVAMKDGLCTVCKNKCVWWVHKNIPYIYEYTCIHVTKSYQEMKRRYEQEKGVTLDFKEYLENLTQDIEKLLELLHGKVKKITDCKNELQRTQETPTANSVDETIDDMINAEEETKNPGFERRIEMYEELKKYSNMIRIRPN